MRVLERYGDLLVVVPKYRPIKKRGQASRMLCVCLLCDSTCTPVAANVRAGRTTSCGNHGRVPLDIPKSYSAIHNRLKKEYGPARLYNCADCPEMAEQWSYVGNSPFEQIGQDTARKSYMAWSPYMRDYTPRCVSCHRKHDDNLPTGRSHRG